MEGTKEIIAAIDPKVFAQLSTRETAKNFIISCPGYSSYSAFLDKAFEIAESIGIDYKGSGHHLGQVYTVTFFPKKKR